MKLWPTTPAEVSRQEKIRAFRHEWEFWASKQGMSVGRDEGGYYDDDEAGSAAWKAAYADADARGVFA